MTRAPRVDEAHTTCRGRRSVALLLLSAACVSACGEATPDVPGFRETDASSGGGTDGVASSLNPYPTLGALYERALAPGCADREGMCHRAKTYPELGSIRDFFGAINAPCQLSEPDGARVLDACEIRGDDLAISTAAGVETIEIMRAVVGDDEPLPARRVRLELARAPSSNVLEERPLRVIRPPSEHAGPLDVELGSALLNHAPETAAIELDLTSSPDAIRRFLDPRAVATTHAHLAQGDPNGNGMAHVAAEPLRLIVPGDPERSTLYLRMRDESFGPRMPPLRDSFDPAALRAMYCFIRALDPATTPEVLREELVLDVEVERCPPDPYAEAPIEPSFDTVKALFARRCAAGPCHSSAARAEDLVLEPTAAHYVETVISVPSRQSPPALRVTPGQPEASYLYCKVDPDCADIKPGTELMPGAGDRLTDAELAAVRRWIADGARVP